MFNRCQVEAWGFEFLMSSFSSALQCRIMLRDTRWCNSKPWIPCFVGECESTCAESYRGTPGGQNVKAANHGFKTHLTASSLLKSNCTQKHHGLVKEATMCAHNAYWFKVLGSIRVRCIYGRICQTSNSPLFFISYFIPNIWGYILFETCLKHICYQKTSATSTHLNL